MQIKFRRQIAILMPDLLRSRNKARMGVRNHCTGNEGFSRWKWRRHLSKKGFAGRLQEINPLTFK
jgi:hypothetical protein